MQEFAALKPVVRGRPAAKMQRLVMQDIMDATEQALGYKTAKEITLQEISSAAHANEAMIRYYFGSKDGLLVTILDNFMNSGPFKMEAEIMESCIESKSISPLTLAISDFYYSHPNILRMIIVETFSASSEIKNAYVKRYGGSTCAMVQSVVEGMKAAGIYRQDVDSLHLTQSLMRDIIAPITQPTATGVPETPAQIRAQDLAISLARAIDAQST